LGVRSKAIFPSADLGIRAAKAVFCVAAIIVTTGCPGMTGKPSATPSDGGTANIRVTPSPINFPAVIVGNDNTQILQISNTGTADLIVTNVTPKGAAFSVSGLNLPITITAGNVAKFTAKFEPATAGMDSGSLSVTSNATATPVVIPWSGQALAATIQLTVNPPSLPFGNITVQNSTSSGVKLTNSGDEDVVISSATVSGTGFSGPAESNLTLAPSQSVTVNVSFDPKSTGSFNGTLTIVSNAPNSPEKVGLSGTGVGQPSPPQPPTQPSVKLQWDPSSSTPVPVVGYFVYRGTVSGGPYSPLNGTADASTSYTDSTVASGLTYYYVVTSVDSNNVQSGFSTQVSVAIP